MMVRRVNNVNPKQIQLVQASFEQVKPIASIAATLFYDRLFELDPFLRPMFSHDLSEQKSKLVATLAFAVAGLAQPERILPAVQQLGRRHAGYGVSDDHYETVGAALLWTLEQGLGEAFTPAVADAWFAAYTLLAGTMREAAREAQPVFA
jgi:hemoglobin-like flavoprotein